MTKKITKKISKFKIIVSLFILVVVGLFVGYKILGNHFQDKFTEEESIVACKNIYSQSIDRFSEQTGINHSNIVYNNYETTLKNGIYIITFNEIEIGNQKDKFICHYNTSTHKALDKSPEVNFS